MEIGVGMAISSESMDVAILAQKAESLGFESLWLPEHPIIPVHSTSRYGGSADGAIPQFMMDLADPFIGLARASAVTQRMKLGTSICLVPEHNPLSQAKQIATLDFLSRGRFFPAVGLGQEEPEEYEACGVAKADRAQRTDEAIQLMRRLWLEEEVTHEGRFFTCHRVTITPKPFQKPATPVWIGGRRA
jgi:probable F420-dependent oxidoreductase